MGETNLILDKGHAPSFEEISLFIKGPAADLWMDFTGFIEEQYKAEPKIAYSRCSGKPGWNVKYQKSGKSLCTLYPEEDGFVVTQKVFPDAPRSLLNLTKSYRSATEIMELGNAISSQLPAGGIAPAQPVLRHCPRPRLIRGDSAEELWGTIPKLIEELEKEDCRSIAVIGKTMDECEALYTLLRPSDPITRPIQLITEKVTDRKESLVIIPGYLAKGLEFDAVIIANAAAGVYGSQEWDVKLLYVACTRAMHRLIILCAGAETPILTRIDGSILARSTF